VGLAFVFVLLTAALHRAVESLDLSTFAAGIASYLALKTCALVVSAAAIFLLYRFLPNRRIASREVLPAAILAGLVAEAVRWVFLQTLPLLDLQKDQGPYYVSVSFALLAYLEAFVLMGGAYMAARPPETG